MNYCEKIHYTILNTEPAEFAVMVTIYCLNYLKTR